MDTRARAPERTWRWRSGLSWGSAMAGGFVTNAAASGNDVKINRRPCSCGHGGGVRGWFFPGGGSVRRSDRRSGGHATSIQIAHGIYRTSRAAPTTDVIPPYPPKTAFGMTHPVCVGVWMCACVCRQ